MISNIPRLKLYTIQTELTSQRAQLLRAAASQLGYRTKHPLLAQLATLGITPFRTSSVVNYKKDHEIVSMYSGTRNWILWAAINMLVLGTAIIGDIYSSGWRQDVSITFIVLGAVSMVTCLYLCNEIVGFGQCTIWSWDTTPLDHYLDAARSVRSLWPGRRLLLRGLGLVSEVKRAGVPIRRGVRGIRAVGRRRINRVVWEGGELAANYLLLHEGVIPNIQLSLALQLRHLWDESQLCWRPALDTWGQTSLPNVAIAGDGGGIAGAEAAVLTGRLAALDAALWLGHIGEAERDSRARPIHAALVREWASRLFLGYLCRPSRSVTVPAEDDIIVCRCEEVSVGEIRRAARLGATGPNQLKAFTRCGMGPCQGRICGPLVTAIIADVHGKPIAEIGTYRPRAPLKPITVGALADLEIPGFASAIKGKTPG